VEQFLHEAKACALRSPLRELTETLRKIEEGEGEAESLSRVIANALERDDDEEEDDECLRAFSAFARKVERLKAIASEVAEMVLVGGDDENENDDDDGDAYDGIGKENATITATGVKHSRSSAARFGRLLPLDAQSQKRKFERKFDDLIAELIVSCGPRRVCVRSNE